MEKVAPGVVCRSIRGRRSGPVRDLVLRPGSSVFAGLRARCEVVVDHLHGGVELLALLATYVVVYRRSSENLNLVNSYRCNRRSTHGGRLW